MGFQSFSDHSALEGFVKAHCKQFAAAGPLVVEEIGDGNINFVYRVGCGDTTVIVKQALPYIRIIGEAWPLSQDRIRIEAQSLRHAAAHCPALVPELYHYDPQQCALIMEDIGDHQSLREALMQRKLQPGLPERLACFMAKTLFYSSDFYLDSHQKKALVAELLNPDLCKSTEDVFFVDPYCDHERNNVHPAVREQAQQLWQNRTLKADVAALKMQFMTQAQAALHGDLHTGSVFVAAQSCKVIDPEFGFVGPIGFDVGVLLANFLLNYCAQPAHADEWRQQLLACVEALWQQFAHQFGGLMAQHTHDPSLQSAEYQAVCLRQIWSDSLGFAGTEMVRRTIGIAQVADWQLLPDEAQGPARRQALQLGQQLIMQRNTVADSAALQALIQAG